jgi:hypothetical protein
MLARAVRMIVRRNAVLVMVDLPEGNEMTDHGQAGEPPA